MLQQDCFEKLSPEFQPTPTSRKCVMHLQNSWSSLTKTNESITLNVLSPWDPQSVCVIVTQHFKNNSYDYENIQILDPFSSPPSANDVLSQKPPPAAPPNFSNNRYHYLTLQDTEIQDSACINSHGKANYKTAKITTVNTRCIL